MRRTRHNQDRILALDPRQDCQEIVRITGTLEFPFDSARALELALFRTFAVPSIGGLLDATHEFTRHPQRRYDATDLLLSEFMEHGYDSDRGRKAIRRMNQLHRRYKIPNEDFVYVLSTFVVEPRRWIERYGWRPLLPHEAEAGVRFWGEVGARMGLKDIPPTGPAMERYHDDYEEAHFRPNPASLRVARATLQFLLDARVPKPLHALGREVMAVFMDPRLRRALEIPEPSPTLEALVEGAMAWRARAIRAWVPERRAPVLRTAMRHPSYPTPYDIEALGEYPIPQGFDPSRLRAEPK